MSCKYCEPKTSKFEPIFISDTQEDCKWCDKDKCDNRDDSCYGVGYSKVPLSFCPNCGENLITITKAEPIFYKNEIEKLLKQAKANGLTVRYVLVSDTKANKVFIDIRNNINESELIKVFDRDENHYELN